MNTMKTTTFSTFDKASQYLVNARDTSGALHSRIRKTNDGKVEALITHADGSQEITLSPPPDRTFEESVVRLKAIVEEAGTQIRVSPLTIDGVTYPGNLDS